MSNRKLVLIAKRFNVCHPPLRMDRRILKNASKDKR